MLTRSGQSMAHRKLGEIHRRWREANRLFGPAVDALPQLLVAPVVLFVAGLIDMLLSNATPVSRSNIPLLVAGVVSCSFVIAVGLYMIWTVLHGCVHNNTSPFQSSLARVVAAYGPHWFAHLKIVPARCAETWHRTKELLRTVKARSILPLWQLGSGHGRVAHAQSLDVTEKRFEQMLDHNGYYGKWDEVKQHEHLAFHSVLKETHEDDIINAAAAALLPLVRSRGAHDDWGIRFRPNHASPPEISTLHYLLSSEASIRSNITAAAAISSLKWDPGDRYGAFHIDNLTKIESDRLPLHGKTSDAST